MVRSHGVAARVAKEDPFLTKIWGSVSSSMDVGNLRLQDLAAEYLKHSPIDDARFALFVSNVFGG